MELHGKNLIAGETSGVGSDAFRAVDPTGNPDDPARDVALEPAFSEATAAELDSALNAAQRAFADYRACSAEDRAKFLEAIADGIVGLGDKLIERAGAETALPEARLNMERGRTVNQIRMFANVVREGSWIGARIDRAIPDREPLPKPDLRRMHVPLGPVVVFGASNFPLAFSVLGGDTAAALAAGCPVVVKGHPAHPGTSEWVGRAAVEAARECGMPAGVFSLVQGATHEVGLELVRHPLTAAVAFTGSLRGGRALFDVAAARPVPIPVYAEMGSTNPVFVLPGAARERGAEFAAGLAQSVTLGVGQFCTCPGLVVTLKDGGAAELTKSVSDAFGSTTPGTMVHAGICRGYEAGLVRLQNAPGVSELARSGKEPLTRNAGAQATAAAFQTSAETYLQSPELGEEVFGPATLLVTCDNREQLEKVANGLDGHLTATLHGTAEDLREYSWLISILETKVGRLLFNGFPTGVEVCASMQHGGPYPATTDSRTTSVGTAAIERFTRPVCYQNFPQDALPLELQDKNVRGIWRMIDGEWTKDDI